MAAAMPGGAFAPAGIVTGTAAGTALVASVGAASAKCATVSDNWVSTS
jgi:hypothetical protein